MLVSSIFYFPPELGEDEFILTSIVFKGVGSTTNDPYSHRNIPRQIYNDLSNRSHLYMVVKSKGIPSNISCSKNYTNLPRCIYIYLYICILYLLYIYINTKYPKTPAVCFVPPFSGEFSVLKNHSHSHGNFHRWNWQGETMEQPVEKGTSGGHRIQLYMGL